MKKKQVAIENERKNYRNFNFLKNKKTSTEYIWNIMDTNQVNNISSMQ